MCYQHPLSIPKYIRILADDSTNPSEQVSQLLPNDLDVFQFSLDVFYNGIYSESASNLIHEMKWI